MNFDWIYLHFINTYYFIVGMMLMTVVTTFIVVKLDKTKKKPKKGKTK